MFIVRESGYFHLQATKPDTIGNYKLLIKVNYIHTFCIDYIFHMTQLMRLTQSERLISDNFMNI